MNIKLDLNKILIYAYQIILKFLAKKVIFILVYTYVFNLILPSLNNFKNLTNLKKIYKIIIFRLYF